MEAKPLPAAAVTADADPAEVTERDGAVARAWLHRERATR